MKKYFILLILLCLILTSCKPKTYKVTFLDDGVVLSSIDVIKGTNLKNIPSPNKDGYIFVTWLKDGVDYNMSNPIMDDITLTASWTETPELMNKHTVTFDIDGVKKTQTIDDGEKASKPIKDPIKEKHIFLGWFVGDTEYDFNLPVTKDILIVAKFKKNRINVTYDLNGGTGSTVAVEIDKNSIPERPKTPTKFGYNFVTWSLDGKPYNFDFPLTSDTTIKAIWEATIYVEVTFDSDGGGTFPPVILSAGSVVSKLPTPVKDGYTFKYWSYNGNKFDATTKVTEDIKLIAIYQQNEVIDDNQVNPETENKEDN